MKQSDMLGQASETIYTVSDVNALVKQALEDNLPEFWIKGEVSNLRKQASGHYYFTLKDEGSQISAVLFRGNAAGMSVQLADGMEIMVYGAISVFEPRGTYQIIVRLVLKSGLGSLQVEFEKLKKKLEAEGLFDEQNKKVIPALPRRIAVITSPTGAAIEDFLNILKRKNWKGEVVIFPSLVQGNDAPEEIIRQLRRVEEFPYVDLLVITRGGGSMEDLWCFNNESLVREIAKSTVPVISAVGHQIDFTLTDFVADLRAETPSAAAHYIVDDYERYLYKLESLAERLKNNSPQKLIEEYSMKLDFLANQLKALSLGSISSKRQSLLTLKSIFNQKDVAGYVKLCREKLININAKVYQLFHQNLKDKRIMFNELGKRLENLNVENILKRGFIIVRDNQGRIVTTAKSAKVGDYLENQFADGIVKVEVVES